jgi:ribosomal protein S18 acetylase RimI-like enzyme
MVIVRDLQRDEFDRAVEVISRGMRDNPIHIQAFGEDPDARSVALTRIFCNVLPVLARKGSVLGAFKGDELVGVTGMARPGECQPRPAEMLRLIPRILSTVGVRSFGRVSRWMNGWKKHDLSEPHWHLGPVAVDAHLQGAGIGSTMMAEYCARIDRTRTAGYLETDKLVNVAFYEKFGFKTIGETKILKIPNWFMRRPPA